MNIKWTKEDAKRAQKMGWVLAFYGGILKSGDRFKTDKEAAEWVVKKIESEYPINRHGFKNLNRFTCRKAILICCRA